MRMMKVIMLGGILDIDEWNHSVVVRNKTEKPLRRFGVFDSFPKIAKRESLYLSIRPLSDQQIMFSHLKGYLLCAYYIYYLLLFCYYIIFIYQEYIT